MQAGEEHPGTRAIRQSGERASFQHSTASHPGRLLDGGEGCQAGAVNLVLRPQVHVAVVRTNVLPIIREVQRAGAEPLRAIAEALNARGIPTARGGRWAAMTVSNVLARA